MEKSQDSLKNQIPPQKYLPLSGGKTFWDDGQYEPVAKRLENGKR